VSIRGDTVTFLGHHHSVVIGHGGLAAVGESLGQVPGITALSEPPTEPRDRSAITVFTTDFGNGTVPPAEWLDRLATREGLTIAVVGAPATAEDLDPTTAREIARLRSAVDATVVIPPEHHRQGVRSVVTTLHEIVARPGVINLDPADIRTVLDHGEAAAITTGRAASTGDVAADTLHAVEDGGPRAGRRGLDANAGVRPRRPGRAPAGGGRQLPPVWRPRGGLHAGRARDGRL